MNKVIEFLKGKKTYGVAFAVAVATFAYAMGWIDTNTLVTIYGFLGAGGLATLRDALKQLKG